ncbi:MerR family transcriptional regulator [Pseudonocardia sp. TRM90224]|uniref:MerR family transcriptional regulator n=1 Tax=Pseudonocardia sp. TRM90224 TaxID=2812678 RepID=UPI001E5878C9|nr:MerR family transcriptional regulator [Pseudonocardia sp. TRM90224]
MGRPSDPELLTTAQVAVHLGVHRRTRYAVRGTRYAVRGTRYAERGWLKPTLTLPSRHMRWNLEDVRRQLAELRERGDADD